MLLSLFRDIHLVHHLMTFFDLLKTNNFNLANPLFSIQGKCVDILSKKCGVDHKNKEYIF